MALLNTAKGLYVGGTPAKAAYAANKKVWPSAPADGFTPFVNPTFTGTGVWVVGDEEATEKGPGIRFANTSGYTTGWRNAIISNAPAIDFQKSWGIKYWMKIHDPNSAGGNYAMLVNSINASDSNAAASQRHWLLCEHALNNQGYIFIQTDRALHPDYPQTNIGRSLGELGGMSQSRWYLVTVEVTVDGNWWGPVKVKMERDDGLHTTEVNYTNQQSVLTAVQNDGSFGMLMGMKQARSAGFSWVPVSWKGTLKA